MSQYSTGLSSVTNGSPTVTGSGTLWSANVSAGDSFTIASTGVMYDVASVDSDTQITLSAPYAGTTASGVVYAIGTGFTVPDSFPEMSQGDIETATIFTRAMRKIQGKISSILAGGANANFTAMPQVGGDPIVESGSNSDGEWTRWADGTQIATAVVSVNFNGDVDLASRRIFNPPVSFIYNESEIDGAVVSSASVADMNSFGRDFANGLLQSFELFGASPGDWVLATLDATTAGAGANLVSVSAIGRWK